MNEVEYAMLVGRLSRKYGEVREGMIKEGLKGHNEKMECSRRQYLYRICKDFDLVRKQVWQKEWLEKKEEQ